jgi:hypothetical protein
MYSQKIVAKERYNKLVEKLLDITEVVDVTFVSY